MYCKDYHGVLIILSSTSIFSLGTPFATSPPSPVVGGRSLDKDTTIKIDGKNVNIDADDLESMCILGRGAYGVVEKVRHIKTGTILAVKV